MGVKTITIDLEAYEALARRKRSGQSFSDVIKERFAGGGTAGDLLRAAGQAHVSDDAIDEVEREVKARRASPARSPRL